MYLTYLLYAVPSRYDHFEGVENLIKDNTIEEFYLTKTPGTMISSEMTSGNRIGALLVRGDSEDELRRKNDRIRDILEAYDLNGKQILRKELIRL